MISEDREETYRALEKAIEAFEKHLTDCGYDLAFWDLKLTAWGVSSEDFRTPLWKVEIDLREGER